MFFVIILVLLGLGACSGGDGGDMSTENLAPIVLEDEEQVFASVGITNLDTLKKRVDSVGPLALSVEVGNVKAEVEPEQVVRLLKENNRNLEYRKIELKGIDLKVTEALKKIKKSPLQLKQAISLPDLSMFPVQNVTPEALESLNQQKLDRLNIELARVGQDPLSMEQFLALQNALASSEIIENYGKLERQYQNVIALDMTTSPSSKRVALRSGIALPAGHTIINAVDELGRDPEAPIFGATSDACLLTELLPPLVVTQPGIEIDTSLITSSEGVATLRFPRPGIAVVLIENAQNARMSISNSDGFVHSLITAEGKHYYYIPIQQNDICQPFTIEGEKVTVVEMVEPLRVSEETFIENNKYLSGGVHNLIAENGLFHPLSYTFSTIGADVVEVLFNVKNSDEETLFTYMLYAPDGKTYVGNKGSINGFTSPISNITMAQGLWRLDIVPKLSVNLREEGLNILTPIVLDYTSTAELDAALYVGTGEKTTSKEFVLGTLNNVSFKTQGEVYGEDEGEVSISLNTNMAPTLNIPPYMETLLRDRDQDNEELALWLCWRDSEQNGTEFENSGACVVYADVYSSVASRLWQTVQYVNGTYEIYDCVDANGEADSCVRSSITDEQRVIDIMNYFSDNKQRAFQDAEYLEILSNYFELYANWKEQTVQSDKGTFPSNDIVYKTHEVLTVGSMNYTPYTPVVITPDRPIFAAPVEVVNKSTLPIVFDYAGSDLDEFDQHAANIAYLKYLYNQASNAATGNIIGMICDHIELLDELHDLELAAEADPLGSAKVTLNRYSVSDYFYGLNTRESFNFYMSGYPEENTKVDTYGDQLYYAQLVCGVANVVSSGVKFAGLHSELLSLDYEMMGISENAYDNILNSFAASGVLITAAEAQEIVELLETGDITGVKERLQSDENVADLTEGRDLFADLETLLAFGTNAGSAANGNNIVKTNAEFLLDPTEKKTRANVTFERVGSVALSKIIVSLDKVKILSNHESGDSFNAEVILTPFIGVVSDKDGNSEHTVFNNTKSDSRSVKYYYGVASGTTLEFPNHSYYYDTDCGNVAAIYVELAITEDDEGGVEDDDMIGIFSKTFKLEEIFNQNAEYQWEKLSETEYRLHINEYPVYDSVNQQSIENPIGDPMNYALQKEHNAERQPSALVSLFIDVTLGDVSVEYPKIDTSLDLGVLATGRDALSMEAKVMSYVTGVSGELIDVFEGHAIVGPEADQGSRGTIYSYDVNTSIITKMFDYDVNDFSGDAIAIKEALLSPASVGRKNTTGSDERELSLVRLLPHNRVLFLISHVDGARALFLSYDEEGFTGVDNDVDILYKNQTTTKVNTLTKAALSPSRTRMLVGVVPPNYTTREIAVKPELQLYTIDGYFLNYRAHREMEDGTFSTILFFSEDDFMVKTNRLVLSSNDDLFSTALISYQESCSAAALNCWFHTVSMDLHSFAIRDDNSIDLIDIHNFYDDHSLTTTMSTLENFLYVRPSRSLTTLSYDPGYSTIVNRSGRLMKYHYEANTQGYVFDSDIPKSGEAETINYNRVGQYFCGHGMLSYGELVCSGHLSSLLKPWNAEADTYHSGEMMSDFAFANLERDQLLALDSGVLKLISLYNGAHYKGPIIEGDVINSTIRVRGDNSMTVSFSITDRDTPVEQLTVELTSLIITGPADYNSTHISDLNCITDINGTYQCTVRISVDPLSDLNLDLNQEIIISVSDGTYTSEAVFNIDHKPFVIFMGGLSDVYSWRLWQTDGTIEGTSIVDPLHSINDVVYSLHQLDQLYIYFVADFSDIDNSVTSIYAIEPRGTPRLLNTTTEFSFVHDVIKLNGYVYFTARPNVTDGLELYRTDTFSVEPERIKRIGDNLLYSRSLTTVDNILYFIVDSNTDVLWTSDGTSDGTSNSEIGVDIIGDLYVADDKVIFYGTRNATGESGLWSYTKVTDTLVLLSTLITSTRYAVSMQGMFYVIFATDYTANSQLWKSDGTTAGTTRVKQFSKYISVRRLTQPPLGADTFYFTDYDRDLWESDGTDSGTEIIIPRQDNKEISAYFMVGSKLYVNIRDTDVSGLHLYWMDPALSYSMNFIKMGEYHSSYYQVNQNMIGEDVLIYGSQFNEDFSASIAADLDKFNPSDGLRNIIRWE